MPVFDTLVHTHGARVLRVCRAALGAGPDADDAWSETFLAALHAWPDLADHPQVEAWLVRVAQRKSIDILRARSRAPLPVPEVPDPGHTPDHDTGLDVWAAVAALPERQRLAIAYHYLGGLPHSETAELTGTTPAAVRRAASDAVRSLRITLRHTEGTS